MQYLLQELPIGEPLLQSNYRHNPLIQMFAKPLGDLQNARVFRFREKLIHYSFSIKWAPGKSHAIGDTLSRTPLFETPEEDEEVAAFNSFHSKPLMMQLMIRGL